MWGAIARGRRTRALITAAVRTACARDGLFLCTCFPTTLGQLNFMVYDSASYRNDSFDTLLDLSAKPTPTGGKLRERRPYHWYVVTKGTLGLLEAVDVVHGPARRASSAKKWRQRQRAVAAAAAHAVTLSYDDGGTLFFVPRTVFHPAPPTVPTPPSPTQGRYPPNDASGAAPTNPAALFDQIVDEIGGHTHEEHGSEDDVAPPPEDDLPRGTAAWCRAHYDRVHSTCPAERDARRAVLDLLTDLESRDGAAGAPRRSSATAPVLSLAPHLRSSPTDGDGAQPRPAAARLRPPAGGC